MRARVRIGVRSYRAGQPGPLMPVSDDLVDGDVLFERLVAEELAVGVATSAIEQALRGEPVSRYVVAESDHDIVEVRISFEEDHE